MGGWTHGIRNAKRVHCGRLIYEEWNRKKKILAGNIRKRKDRGRRKRSDRFSAPKDLAKKGGETDYDEGVREPEELMRTISSQRKERSRERENWERPRRGETECKNNA